MPVSRYQYGQLPRSPFRGRSHYFRIADKTGAIREALLSFSRRYAVRVRPLFVDNICFRLVNKPGASMKRLARVFPSLR